jgi:type IV pilus assembly protein PilV
MSKMTYRPVFKIKSSSFITRQKGATMIEVLVAIIILAVGLLGLAGLQRVSIQSNYSAYYRSQATLLASDLIDRMRANRTAAKAGSYDRTSTAVQCNTNLSPTGTIANSDITQWLNTIACTLPSGTGSVSRTGDLFTVSINWDDTRGQIKATNSTSTLTQNFTYQTEL